MPVGFLFPKQCAAEAELLVSTLMGDAVDLRKAYIVEHANFNKQDNFTATN